MNYSDVRIGEYINQITYCELTGMDYGSFKNLRTHRSIFYVKDLIPDFIKYETPSLIAFLEKFKQDTFTLDDDFSYEVTLGDITSTIAKGGIHSIDDAREFKCKKGWSLYELDVGSMYPKSIIEGNLFPEHLGPSWRLGIKKLYDERINDLKPALKILDKKSADYKFIDSKQTSYKFAMNGGGYGKTNEIHSWQYDPMVTMKVTIRGQLALLMLMEMLHLIGIELVSANTDGIVIHHPDDRLPEVEKVWRRWEKNYSI